MCSDGKGSPPQVRGKLVPTPDTQLEKRITPAGAGKTQRQIRQRSVCWDHPRRCGENPPKSGIGGMVGGSPPRMRGKHAEVAAGVSTDRITPADAGKTKV